MDGERAERKRKHGEISAEEDDVANSHGNINELKASSGTSDQEDDGVDEDQNDTSLFLNSTLDVTGIVGDDNGEEPNYTFPRIHSGMSISDLKVEAWERGWAAPDAAGKTELLSYLRVGSICISRVKQIAKEELLSMDPALAEGRETTAADIFRLNGMPFIDIEELYRASVFVSKAFEDQCQRELRRRCKKVHPALFKAVTSNPRLRLTYKMWKRFEMEPFAVVMNGTGTTWPTLQPSSLDKKDGNIDVLLEVSFGGKVRIASISPLCYHPTKKRVHANLRASAPGIKIRKASDGEIRRMVIRSSIGPPQSRNLYWRDNSDVSIEQKALVNHLFLHGRVRVRAVLFRRATGELAPILDETRPLRIVGNDYGLNGELRVEYGHHAHNVIAKTSTGVKLLVYPVVGITYYFEQDAAATEGDKIRLACSPPPWSQGIAKAKFPFEIQLRHGAPLANQPARVLDSERAETTVMAFLRRLRWG